MADVKKFIEEVKSMTVLELNELVKALEEEFGVSAAAPVAVAAAPAAGAAPAAAAEEKTEFNVVLKIAAQRKSTLSKLSAPSPVSDLSKLSRQLKRAEFSKRTLLRKKQTKSLQTLKRLAQLRFSNNFTFKNNKKNRILVGYGFFVYTMLTILLHSFNSALTKCR